MEVIQYSAAALGKVETLANEGAKGGLTGEERGVRERATRGERDRMCVGGREGKEAGREKLGEDGRENEKGSV